VEDEMSKMYRLGWLGFCVLIGLGGAVGTANWQPQLLVLLFAVAAATGGMVALVALNPEDTGRSSRAQWTVAAKSTVLAGVGTVVLVGLGSLIGAPRTAVVAVLIIGGSPYVAARWLPWFAGAQRQPSTRQMAAPAHDRLLDRSKRRPLPYLPAELSGLSELSDEALCLAWRASFSNLDRAASPVDRLRVVEERHGYLDELVRRHPDGIAAWLASGPRAAGDPTRFVRGDSTHGHQAINWNDLIQGTDS
jgi:hypothetical protein